MIRVSLENLIFIYLLLFLAAVFVTWIAQGILRRRRDAETLQHRVRCTMCAFEFEDTSETPLPRCPRCASLNERCRFRSL